MPAGSAPGAVSAARGTLGILPLPAVHERALAAVIAAHSDLVQALAVPAALVADARWAQEAGVSVCHAGSIAAGSLIVRYGHDRKAIATAATMATTAARTATHVHAGGSIVTWMVSPRASMRRFMAAAPAALGTAR